MADLPPSPIFILHPTILQLRLRRRYHRCLPREALRIHSPLSSRPGQRIRITPRSPSLLRQLPVPNISKHSLCNLDWRQRCGKCMGRLQLEHAFQTNSQSILRSSAEALQLGCQELPVLNRASDPEDSSCSRRIQQRAKSRRGCGGYL